MGILNKIIAGLSVATLSLGVSGAAMAGVTFGDGGAALESVLDSITTAPVAGDTSVDVNADQLLSDEYWSVTAAGGSVSTMIIELASFAPNNTFGVYDKTAPGSQVVLFNGAAAAGSQVVLSVKADGSIHVNFVDSGVDFAGNNFGFFLDSSANGPTGGFFYSDTSLNADQVDHMAAYQGTSTDWVQTPLNAPGLWTDNEFILAWEDLLGGGDADYTDMVLMIESVIPNVPEPGLLGLLGFGLLGMGVAARRRRTA